MPVSAYVLIQTEVGKAAQVATSRRIILKASNRSGRISPAFTW